MGLALEPHPMHRFFSLAKMLRLCPSRNALVKGEKHVYRGASTQVYFTLGLPNTSHVLNSGDQLISVICRSHVRKRPKLRLLLLYENCRGKA